MKGRILAAILAAGASRSLVSAEPGWTDLGSAQELQQWAPLAESLAAKGAVQAPFTERRYFPFRRKPTVLAGVMRFSPSRGLSLQYTSSEPGVLVVDSDGILFKDSKGRSHALGADPGGIASLLPIMRFELAALLPQFEVAAQGGPSAWKLRFTPNAPELAQSLEWIEVAGAGEAVRGLTFLKRGGGRIEIELGQARTGRVFSESEIRRYFR